MNQPTSPELKTPYTVILDSGSPEAKRTEIRQYFHDTFDAYEALFETVVDRKAYCERADPLRHPIIFYYGHTATFFMNKLLLGKYVDRRINPKFESMFAIGVDEMSWDDLNEQHYEWPTVESVRHYRQQVRELIDETISKTPLSIPVEWDSLYWVLMMGIEHERIHLETTSVLIRQLPTKYLDASHPLWRISTDDSETPSNELLEVPSGEVSLGKNRQSSIYGWDLEYGVHRQSVEAFRASKYLVSNREFLEFVEDGGYAEKSHWTEEGWNWVTYKEAKCPLFWIPQAKGTYRYRALLQEVEMAWSWPVETNYLEAKAFCKWKSQKSGQPIRLPSEEEWYRLLDYVEVPDVTQWASAPGNLNLEGPASSVPVNQHAFQHGFYDVVGNVWQHTETPVRSFAGFEVHPLYDDFSTPTFDTKHNIIKGGSWISTGNEITRDARYAFRRHFYQHAGFRYIESDAEVAIPDDSYETDPEVLPYCELHYGDDYFGVENYPERLAQICLALAQGRARGKALNLGCKTGRATFELAVEFAHVTGIDFTARMIRTGVELKEKGYTQYTLPEEGEIVSFRQRNLQELGLDRCRNKVEFLQGDLSNLKDLYRGYDLILVDTVLEYAYDPAKFLADVHERVNANGLLVIASSCDWQTGRTDRERWLGGYKVDGENTTTFDRLEQILEPNFKLIEKPCEIQQVLPRSKRVFEHKVVEVTAWERKG